MKITSAQNPLIKLIAKANNQFKTRKKENLVLLDGVHLCEESLKQGNAFKHLFVTTKFKENIEFNKFKSVKNMVEIPENLMQKITATNSPIGILGVINQPKTIAPQKVNDDLILVLENIQDPGNMGTIIRTAVAAGVKSIFCDAQCTDIFSPKVMRAGMGGHFHIKIFENFDLFQLPQIFDGEILGTFLDPKTQNLFETKLSQKTAFVFGSEGQGISDNLKKICSRKIIIPMANDFESLNVSVATAICLFEHVRQNQYSGR